METVKEFMEWLQKRLDGIVMTNDELEQFKLKFIDLIEQYRNK